MIIKNFKRTELKYIISDSKKTLLNELSSYMELDKHGITSISSAYVDTNNWDIISRSIEKPFYKEKVRIRCYGEPNNTDPVFLELKKKYDGVVYKRRVILSRNAAIMFLSGTSYKEAVTLAPLKNNEMHQNSISKNSMQIAREITAFMERHNYPNIKVITKYSRNSYKIKNNELIYNSKNNIDKNLRITIDYNLSYCDVAKSGIHFKDEDFDELIPKNKSILEIKCRTVIPLWLNDILSEEKIRPTSFSKCVTAAQKIHDNNKNKKGGF